jgi:FkbM family methyltransferase
MIRTIVERLSRKVILKRRLPSRVGGGSVFVSPDASLKFWRRDLNKADSLLFDWATEFVSRGQVVWDIGANVGMFAFAAAHLAGTKGQVFAIEADIWLAGLLRRTQQSLSVNNASVEVIPVAVSESLGIARFNIARRGRSTNYLSNSSGSTQTGGVRESVSVVTVTLDWLAQNLPPPDVLKIDVEGAELRVLEGARNLLATAQPIVLCEVDAGNSQGVADLLHSYKYTMFDLEIGSAGRKPLPQPAFNTLACPISK